MHYFLILVVAALAACTRPNPDYKCCVTEADCAANNISEITPCDDGFLCRGSKCIQQTCGGAGECDSAAPYCTGAPEGVCSLQCGDDNDCPGFGQSATSQFCVGGACVECRIDAECRPQAPVCGEGGTCRPCQDHGECPSGMCGYGGACANEDEIAFASPTGVSTGTCARSAPCTLERAIYDAASRPYVGVGDGTYLLPTELVLSGQRWLKSTGPGRPTLARTTAGDGLVIQPGSNITIDGLRVQGVATGSGILSDGGATLHLLDMVVANNANAGLRSRFGTVIARNSVFSENQTGVSASDANLDLDACVIRNNEIGVSFDIGTLKITNSFIVRNQGQGGLYLYDSTPENSQVEFNTIVDNSIGIDCSGPVLASYPNNVIARNGTNVTGEGTFCTTTGSLVLGNDITPLRFKAPDTMPYDYHVLPGSLAIDAAVASTVDHDYDGEARPRGAERDVGADEAE